MAKKEKDNNEQEKWLKTPTSIRLKDAGHGEMRSHNFSKTCQTCSLCHFDRAFVTSIRSHVLTYIDHL